MAHDRPRVVCSVLNWNNYEDTRSCLQSLLDSQYENLEVVLVDNGSTDGSGRALDREFPAVASLLLEDNHGFGGGHNHGIRWAQERDAAYVVLVNNDAVVADRDLFDDLVDAMEANNDIGVMTPQVYQAGDHEKCHFRRGVIHDETATPDYEYPAVDAETELLDNDYVPFVTAMIRSTIFDAVGLHPEEYFLYYGDLDYCTRIRDAGFRITTYLPGRVYHEVSASAGSSVGSIRSYYNMRNRFTWARHFPERVDRSTFYRESVRYFLHQVVRRIYHREWAGLVALVRGATDGLRGVTGKGPYP